MRHVIFLFFLLYVKYVFPQSDSLVRGKWKQEGFLGLNFSQTSLSNWQGGGQDNVVISGIVNYQLTYTKGKSMWVNKLDAQYGIQRPGNYKLFRKNTDQLFFISKYNREAWNKQFSYSFQADYRTQFAPGYNYIGDSIAGRATSDFHSPVYVQGALGLNYNPVTWFSAFASFISGKTTYVDRQYLADAGAFGVEKAQTDNSGNILRPGKKFRAEAGARLIVKFKKDVLPNINWDSYLDLFSNYMHNPQNIDVIFNNLLTFKINKFFTTTFLCQMIYDDDIIIKRDWNKDGKYNHPSDINGPRLQILSTLGIGIGYKF